VKKYQDQGNLETTMAEKRTRDAIEELEQEVLEQHKRYSPKTLTCTRRESGYLHSLSVSSLATACLNKSCLLKRQEEGYTPSWPLGVSLTRRMQNGHWLFLFKQRTSANMNSLLQTARLDSLKAWPERKSVIILAHTSDSSVKAFMPTLLGSHQRLTMLRQRIASNVVANSMAEQLANKGTAASNEAAPNRLVAFYNLEEEERGRATNRAHATKSAFITPILAPLIPKEICRVYLAPILDKTPVNTSTFFATMTSDALHKRLGIIWSKASIRGEH
jgi:hypothetical protein